MLEDLGPFQKSRFPKNPKTGLFEAKKAPAGSLGPQKAYNGARIDCDLSKYKDLGPFEKSIFPKKSQTVFWEEKTLREAWGLTKPLR